MLERIDPEIVLLSPRATRTGRRRPRARAAPRRSRREARRRSSRRRRRARIWSRSNVPESMPRSSTSSDAATLFGRDTNRIAPRRRSRSLVAGCGGEGRRDRERHRRRPPRPARRRGRRAGRASRTTSAHPSTARRGCPTRGGREDRRQVQERPLGGQDDKSYLVSFLWLDQDAGVSREVHVNFRGLPGADDDPELREHPHGRRARRFASRSRASPIRSRKKRRSATSRPRSTPPTRGSTSGTCSTVEAERLAVHGLASTSSSPYSYAQVVEEPRSDDPRSRRARADRLELHATDATETARQRGGRGARWRPVIYELVDQLAGSPPRAQRWPALTRAAPAGRARASSSTTTSRSSCRRCITRS